VTALSRRACAFAIIFVFAAVSIGLRAGPASATLPANGRIAYTYGSDVKLPNADATQFTLFAGSAPSWTPDGQRLRYRSDNGTFMSVLADGTDLQTIGKLGVTWPAQGVSFSADGKRALYWNQTTTLPGGGSGENIFVHNFVTNTDVDILPRAVLDRAPAWSPDEHTIAFHSGSDTTPQLWLMTSDGTSLRKVPNQPAGNNFGPTFSPDGTKLLFTNSAIGSITNRLYVIGVDGSNPHQVGPSDRNNTAPAFSPDGTKIVYTSMMAGPDDGGTNGLYVMNADGTNPARIYVGNLVGSGAWQPVTSSAPNVAPHPYGSAAQKGPRTLFGDASWAFDDDGWIQRYEWRWGDNTALTPNKYAWHKYAAPGTYLVRLTVYDNNGASATKKAWITVT
jgi:TolB protein